jgi:Ca2+-binding EF-hand superfamily protein
MTHGIMYGSGRYESVRSADGRVQVLKPACAEALRRIFKLCDANKDGLLDSAELNDFQVPPLPPPAAVYPG